MKLVKKRINFVVDKSIDINNNKVIEVEEIEQFSDGTLKEVTIVNPSLPTLAELVQLFILNLKERGYTVE